MRGLPVIRPEFGLEGKRFPIRSNPVGEGQKPAEKMHECRFGRRRAGRGDLGEPVQQRPAEDRLLGLPVIRR